MFWDHRTIRLMKLMALTMLSVAIKRHYSSVFPLLLLLLMSFIWRKFIYVQQVRHVGCCMFMSSEMFAVVSETQTVTLLASF